MKKLLVVSLLLNVAFVLAAWRDEAPAVAEGGGAGVSQSFQCYDANGDGDVDIADPVALLNWLFLGSETPDICPKGAGAPSGLPDTGQTLCYGLGKGPVVDCTSDTCAGQDGLYATGCHGEGRFVDNKDGTVTDTCTGLMWERDTGNDANRLAWCDALAYCEDLEFAGHDDWRLPNVREAQSIADYGRVNPSIDPIFGVVTSFYWSSTTRVNDDVDAWHVNFSEGLILRAGKTDRDYVRAVRTVQ